MAQFIVAAALAFLPLAWSQTEQKTSGLIENPGLEEVDSSGRPAGWEPLVIGAPARLNEDQKEKHGGQRSFRLAAAEVTRAYLHSGLVPVAAGERLRIGAWVKTRDVPAGQGTVILIAEFGQGEPRSREVTKVATADPRLADWQHLEGVVPIPAGVTTLRLRMGFSYSKGTAWWDDVSVQPVAPVAVRADLPEGRLYPGAKTLYLKLLNRARLKEELRVHLQMDGQASEQNVALTGEPTQQVAVALPAIKRGKRTLKLELLKAGQDKPVFASPDTEAIVPPPLTLFPLIPTHGIVEDGAQRLEGELELALDGPAQAGTLTVRLEDAAGKIHAKWEKSSPDSPPAGYVEFKMDVPQLPEGQYRVLAEVASGAGSPARAEQPWQIIPRRKARVTLNSAGFPEREGRAIFPRGMFNNTARIEESAAAGFNVVHAYNAARVHPGRRPDDARLKSVLDQAAKAGMHFLLLVPMEFAFSGEWDAFRRRIRMFRNHPALLAWDEEEGIARGDMNIEALRKIRQILQEEDPNHPFMVGDAHDVIGRVTDRSRFFPAEHMDLGMWWWYPLPLKAGSADALQGEEASGGVVLDVPEFLTKRSTRKPVWIAVQSYKKSGSTARYPTPAEYRAQAYLGVIHEARGLMWYGGSVTGGLFLSPQEGHWEELKGLLRELRDLEPLLLAPSAGPIRFEPADAPISVALKEAGGRRVLMAVNRGNVAKDITFSIQSDGAVQVIGEDRTAAVNAGQLKDRFDPYATHVYEWK